MLIPVVVCALGSVIGVGSQFAVSDVCNVLMLIEAKQCSSGKIVLYTIDLYFYQCVVCDGVI